VVATNQIPANHCRVSRSNAVRGRIVTPNRRDGEQSVVFLPSAGTRFHTETMSLANGLLPLTDVTPVEAIKAAVKADMAVRLARLGSTIVEKKWFRRRGHPLIEKWLGCQLGQFLRRSNL